MFDKLIESEPESADFKSRWSYFMVSSLVVGIFFVTAVVFSLYAADISLGHDNFVLSTMVAPPAPIEPVIQQTQPQQLRSASASRDTIISRKIIMSRVDDPKNVPPSTSVVANDHLAMPISGRFKVGIDANPVSYGGSGRGDSYDPSGPPSEGLSATKAVAEVARELDPPPVVKPPPSKSEPPRSLGVVNGRASHLPKPAYPQAAIVMNAQGKVDVQVLIDESGKVISAKAISGHPLLKDAAVRSAWSARFTPTKLSNVPVKVTGVIVYNFTR